jgi:hypothetical protein
MWEERTAELRARFETDGFVLVEGFLAPAQLAEVEARHRRG